MKGRRRGGSRSRTSMRVYAAAELPVGYYFVRFEAAGMNMAAREHVKVDVGAETRVDATLSAQTLAQSFDINAQAPVLQQDSSALAEVVDTRQAQDLPI